MNVFWFLRAKRWAQHPPSLKKVILVAAVIAACVAIYLIERALGGGGDGTMTNWNWRRPNF